MSVRKQSRERLLRNTTSLFRLLILLSFISDDVCEDISCPKLFKDMTVEKVNCSFDLTSIGAPNCLPIPTDVLFIFSNTSVKTVNLCSTPSDGTCGEEPVGNMNCSCIRSAAGIHTYQLNFMGSKTSYSGGNITCTLFCSPSPPVLKSDNCTFLKFEETATAPSTTPDYTSGPTLPSHITASNATVNVSDCSKSCIIGLSVGIPLVVIVVVIIGALYKKGMISCPPKCCKPTTNNSNSSQEAKPEPNATPLNEAPKSKPSVSH